MGYDTFFRFYSKDDFLLVSQDILSIIEDGYSILVESSRTISALRESVVERAIDNSALAVFFISANTNLSESSFLDEISYADKEGKKTICVLLDNYSEVIPDIVSIKNDIDPLRFDSADPSSTIKQLRAHIASTELRQSSNEPIISLEHFFALGKYYSVTEDYEQAAINFRLAAGQEYAPAQFELAHIYMYGRGCSRSDSEAEKWLLKAAKQEYTPAQFELACNYIVGHGFKKNNNEALRWLQNAAQLGNTQAQVFLGQLYHKGEICEQDNNQAVFWFVAAAIKGNKKAQYELGNCYLFGHGVAMDYSEGLKWLRFAAEKNYPDAQYLVGVCHENGYGTHINYQEAMKWYKLAAEKDFTPAHCSIGDLYMKGLGVTKSHQDAVKWYRLAAEKGSSKAKELLNQLDESSAVNKNHIVGFYEILRKKLKVVSKKLNVFQRFMK